MASDLDPMTPGNDDALSLFGPEANAVANAASPVAAAPSPARAASTGHERADVATPPNSDGVLAIEAISQTSHFNFVEGVALIQAMGAAIKAKGSANAGMPDLRGVFLTAGGEVAAISPPTGEPAARELARLLHRLVPPQTTPPMGRLLIDRWASGDSTDLTQLASELEYFARPNGRELLASVYARCAGTTPSASATVPPLAAAAPEVPRAPEPTADEEVAPTQAKDSWRVWLLAHRRQLATAAVVVVSTVVLTVLGTWFWPARTAAAASPPVPLSTAATTETAETKTVPSVSKAQSVPGRRPGGDGGGEGSPASRAATNESESAPAAATPQSAQAPIVPSSGEPPTVDLLLSRNGPDMRIYSGTDPGVEAPKLRSNEIPEFLIAGFPARANWVEVLVSEKGEVETVKMVGPPQRIPDVMLLSRVKEWTFDPATRNGTAVRYRLLLSWNVTP